MAKLNITVRLISTDDKSRWYEMWEDYLKFYKKSYLPLFLGIACAFGIFLGAKLNFSNGSESLFASNPKKEKLNRLIDYIDYEYVDQVNTDSKSKKKFFYHSKVNP